MKSLIYVLAAAVLAPSISFANGEKCLRDLQSTGASYAKYNLLADQKDGIPELRDCKNVEFNTNDGSQIRNKVYVTADNSSLIIQDNNQRTISLNRIPGLIADFKVMAGRLIIRTADSKVLVVGRNGSVLEMLNGSGKSYTTVSSIAIRDGVLVMTQNNGSGDIQLQESQVTSRLNDAGKFRAVSF